VSGERILIVDDEPLVRSCYARVLKRAGYEVAVHHSGFGLTVTLSEFAPDILILDINMPGLTGDAAIRAGAGLFRTVVLPPLIVISGIGSDEMNRRAASIGAVAQLNKPMDNQDLIDCVEEVLNRHVRSLDQDAKIGGKVL